jgi:hypothetical protein
MLWLDGFPKFRVVDVVLLESRGSKNVRCVENLLSSLGPNACFPQRCPLHARPSRPCPRAIGFDKTSPRHIIRLKDLACGADQTLLIFGRNLRQQLAVIGDRFEQFRRGTQLLLRDRLRCRYLWEATYIGV